MTTLFSYHSRFLLAFTACLLFPPNGAEGQSKSSREAVHRLKKTVPPIFEVKASVLAPKNYRYEFASLRRVQPYFEVRCTVTNISKIMQTIQTMSCSWSQNWQTSDRRIFCPGWECGKNILVFIKLAPGKSYEKVLPLSALPQAYGKTVQFRIGFLSHFGFGKKPKPSVTWSAPLSFRP